MKSKDTHVDIGIKGEVGIGAQNVSVSIGGTSAHDDYTDFFVSISTSSGIEKGTKKPSTYFSFWLNFFVNASNSGIPASGTAKNSVSTNVSGSYRMFGVSHKKTLSGGTQIGLSVGPKIKKTSVKGSINTTNTRTWRTR